MTSTILKKQFWKKSINKDVSNDFIQYVDDFYSSTWNKDLVARISKEFSLSVTTAQLRAYAKKFGLIKQIDNRQKAILLLQRNNPEATNETITDAIKFIISEGKNHTNGEIASILLSRFSLKITEIQLGDKINPWLGIKKSKSTIARGRKNTLAALSQYYNDKHGDFSRILARYPDSMTVIIASILGDAELSPVKRGYAVFRDHHSQEQHGWLEYKASLLPPEPYFRFIYYKSGSMSLVSQSNPLFQNLRNLFYLPSGSSEEANKYNIKREKQLGKDAAKLVESVFSKNPGLALAILIGDDGTLSAFTNGKTVHFEYIIYCQGFSKESALILKSIIEKTAGLRLSITQASGEKGIRLTICSIEQIQKVSNLIGPYLSQERSGLFRKKYDLEWHRKRLSEKHGKELSLGQPVNLWTENEIAIINEGILNKYNPTSIHKRLVEQGYERTYFACYYKYRQLKDSMYIKS